MFSVSMPNSATFEAFVDTATKWRATEVAAADADVHHVAQRTPRVADPLTRPHTGCEAGHLLQYGVDVGNVVGAFDSQRRALGHAQCDVQHGPVLGRVDVVAAEHRVD